MTFFNKNEEILEIKLTSYGKQKLASGKFKPVYYAFFDDDILYDGARAGITEDNNDIEPRIQENTPSVRVQTSFTDLEKRVMLQTHDVQNEVYHESNVTDLKNDPSVFQDYDGLRSVLPLGNSQLGNQYTAAWKVDFLESGFKSYRTTTRDATLSCSAPYRCQKPDINIPQINSDLTVQPVLVDKDFVGIVDPVTGRYASTNPDTEQFIRLTKDFILLDVEEYNVDLLNDSFSVEVYEVVSGSEGEEILEPKMFRKEIEYIVDGILLDKEEVDKQITGGEIDNNFVEFFFDVSVDDSIDNKTKFEKIVSRETRGNIFDNNVGYDEYVQTPGSELYTSDNDGDEC